MKNLEVPVESFRPRMLEIPHVPGEALVKIRKGQLQALLERKELQGVSLKKTINILAGDFIVLKTASQSIFTFIDQLNDFSEVEYAEPNYINQSFMADVKAEKTASDFKAKQVVIDSISQKSMINETQINKKSIPRNKAGHHVDDITLKDILLLSEAVPVSLSEAVEAIDYATKVKVDIVSHTWVRDGFSKALNDAIHTANTKGVSFETANVYGNHPANQSITKIMDAEVSNFNAHIPPAAAAHVSAGILRLYIAQENRDVKSGRGRLIVSSLSSEEANTTLPAADMPADGKNVHLSQSYSFPDAKFIKLEIDKFDTNGNLDSIILKDAKGRVIKQIVGSGVSYETDYIETNFITVEFISDVSDMNYGSIIRNVKIIY